MDTAGSGATSRAATTAFVLGIVGVVCCQLIGPVAWILGSTELKAIREGRSAAAGRGFAQAGLILGIVGTGLLLVSLLIVPAILIPNFLDAMQKAKQKRTVADLRSLGSALDTYCADQPDPNRCYPEASSLQELAADLVPGYLAAPITVDGWKRPLRYACWADAGESGCQHVTLRSAGRDGEFEFEDASDYPGGSFPINAYDRDIVWVDGAFRQHPDYGPPGQR